MKLKKTKPTKRFGDVLTDLLMGETAVKIYKMWGGRPPISMGDGVRFRVTKSPNVDYVYIRYLGGHDLFEVEFGALVGTEYDVLDRMPVKADRLLATISQKIFFGRYLLA